MTLNATIVMTRVRIAGCRDEPANPLADVAEHALRLRRRVRARGGVAASCRRPSPVSSSALVARVRAHVAGEAADQQGTEQVADGIGSERNRRAGDEQEGADRRRDELVDAEERAGHPNVRRREVLARHDPGQQAALGDVRERLGRAEQEQRAQDEGDVHRAVDDRRREEREDRSRARR